MKIYIASSFEHVDRVKLLAADLEGLGHSITCKWWERVFEIPGEGPTATTELKKRYATMAREEFYKLPETAISFKADVEGIRQADILVFLASPDVRKYNGAAVEFGIAYGLGKPCLLLGRLENSVMFLPLERIETELELINRLFRGDKV